MAKSSITGVSKTTETESTGISAESYSLLSQMGKEYKTILETLVKKTSESNKITDELGYKLDEAYEYIKKRSDEVEELDSKIKKLVKNSDKLTEDQQQLLEGELKKDILLLFDSFKEVPSDMKEFMLTFSNIAGAKDLHKSFESITSITKSIEDIVSYNKKISERNEKIDSDREKLKEQFDASAWIENAKTFGKDTLYRSFESLSNALGPFSTLAQPAGQFLFKEVPLIFSALRRKKKIISPTEGAMRKGGIEGASSIYLAKSIDKSLKKYNGQDDSLEDTIKDGIATAFGFSAGSSLKSVLSSVLSFAFSPAGLATTALVGFVGFTAWSTFRDEMGKVYENAIKTADSYTQNDIDVNNSGSVSIRELDAAINKAITENRTLSSWFDLKETEEERIAARKEIAKVLLGKLSEDVLANSQAAVDWANNTAGVITPGSPETVWQGGIYRYIDPVSGLGSDFFVPAGYDPKVWSEYWVDQQRALGNKLANLSPDKLTQMQLTSTYTEAELRKLLQEEGSKSVPNEGMIKNIFGAINAKQKGFSYDPLLDTMPINLNDAIIYKDNSVYVPHPDDNIVLTKDDVSTPVLSNSFESNLFNLLEELLSKKSSGASVVSVQSVKPQIDFSLLRI